MNIIFDRAIIIAMENKSVIIRLDIQFNSETQSYTGYLTLANGREYSIRLAGSVVRVNV